MLEKRARIVRAIRSFFDARDFIEVETAVRIPAPAPEPYIDCPPVVGGGYLRASPELQMKKLLALGMDRIYQMGPCFREGEKGDRHNPEFTMLEWYRRNEDYRKIAEDLVEMLKELKPFSAVDLRLDNIVYLTVREAYLKFAEWDPFAAWDADRFDFDMATKIEPALKELGGGVFLMDYPPAAASLSKLRGEVAERWEFYYDGMELANCFTELCDAEEQSKRFHEAKAKRRELNEADYPLDEDFLCQLSRIGSAAGVALGVDRLIMVLTGAKTISSVRSYPS